MLEPESDQHSCIPGDENTSQQLRERNRWKLKLIDEGRLIKGSRPSMRLERPGIKSAEEDRSDSLKRA